jgi:hypothetical protein
MGIIKNLKNIYIDYKLKQHKDPHPIINVNGQDVIFVHILKTAGTSVTNAIGQEFKLHLPVTEIIRRVGEDKFENAFSFSFVRNPWDKVYSHYKYNVKTNQHLMKTKPIDFNIWVKKCFGEVKDYFYYHRQIQFTDQLTWLKNNDGKIAVDFIGKFENISEDFKIIQEKLKLKCGLPHLNQTQKISYREQYSQEACDIVARAFKADIEYFNYTF